MSLYVFDKETYPNCYTFAIVREDGKHKRLFEISDRKNEIEKLFVCFDYLMNEKHTLVGFNNLNFDYPIMHEMIANRKKILKMSGGELSAWVYKIAQKQIDSLRDGFANTIPEEEHYIRQIDLFKINHFDNKAKMTSLKQIEFNMRMMNIQELPFPVGEYLSHEQMDVLCEYNHHDTEATRLFLLECLPAIHLRDDLTKKYGIDFTNFNDTKIGKKYFEMLLKQSGIVTHKKEGHRTVMIQSKRQYVRIKECLFNYYDFKRPEFIAIKDWFSKQIITETKGVFSDIEEHKLGDVAQYAEMVVKKVKFKAEPSQGEIEKFMREHPKGWIHKEKLAAMEIVRDAEGNIVKEEYVDENGKVKKRSVKVHKYSYYGCYRIAETLNVVINGFRIDYGVGGVHGSISGVVKENDEYEIIDADVASMYPNIAISNKVYPEHLSKKFCDIYQDVYEQRKSFKKGTAENATMKLALNGVYGDSNNEYSIFYDPKYTMTITINGQLSLSLLGDKLLDIEGIKFISWNTDGICVKIPREKREQFEQICKDWEKQVKLELEFAYYSKMFVRDVNNYVGIYTNGKSKNKGAYEWKDLPHHKDHSMKVVPMAVEAYYTKGISVNQFIEEHKDLFDFMLRVKVPKSSSLWLETPLDNIKQQNICRYYVSTTGGDLVKVMPPVEGKEEDRRMMIQAGKKCTPCNFIESIDNIKDIDYNFYIEEANKLIINNEVLI